MHPCLITTNVSNPKAAVIQILSKSEDKTVGSHLLYLLSVNKNIASCSFTSSYIHSTSDITFLYSSSSLPYYFDTGGGCPGIGIVILTALTFALGHIYNIAFAALSALN